MGRVLTGLTLGRWCRAPHVVVHRWRRAWRRVRGCDSVQAGSAIQRYSALRAGGGASRDEHLDDQTHLLSGADGRSRDSAARRCRANPLQFSYFGVAASSFTGLCLLFMRQNLGPRPLWGVNGATGASVLLGGGGGRGGFVCPGRWRAPLTPWHRCRDGRHGPRTPWSGPVSPVAPSGPRVLKAAPAEVEAAGRFVRRWAR